MGVGVEILSVGVLELEITLGVFYPPPLISITCINNTLAIRGLIVLTGPINFANNVFIQRF